MKYVATLAGQVFEIEINSEDQVTVNGRNQTIDFCSVSGQPVYSLIVDGESYEAYVQPTDTDLRVLLQGQLHIVHVEDERQRKLRESSVGPALSSGEFHLNAPMAGLIVAVPIVEGELVAKGQELVILESMKMQNELKAPRDATVTRVSVRVGDSVKQNQLLVTLD
jgi:acetyl/propionyl-CoA carboxylase alpha subunit